MKAGSGALLCLLSASVASAAPGPRHVDGRHLCDAQSPRLLKLLRHPKSFGGPLAAKPRASRLGLRFDLTAHLRRTKRTTVGIDTAAIQNDAPAARVDADDGPVPALRPLGFLIGPVDSHPRTRTFSPRCPRGPPASV